MNHLLQVRRAGVVSAIALLACAHAQTPSTSTPANQAAKFVAEGSVLYREDVSGRTPLLLLDSAGARSGVPIAPQQWTPAPGSSFRVAAQSFRYVVPSPSADWVAWETQSTHELLGLIPGRGGNLIVLDFFFDSSARELTWAPGGRYLAAFYSAPSGYNELRIYDARTGARLTTPWGKDCRPDNDCQVVTASWSGSSTISIRTSARAYTADVSQLP